MRTTSLAIALSLLAGCAPAPMAPPAVGTLEAHVTLPGYRTLELASDLSTISCSVAGQSQELGSAQLELGRFVFALEAGTASVVTRALSTTGATIGQAEAVVGIRQGQVTLLRQVLTIGGSHDSFLHPLTPLPL